MRGCMINVIYLTHIITSIRFTPPVYTHVHSLMGAFTDREGKIGLLAFNLTKTRLYLPNHDEKDDEIAYMKSLGITDKAIEVSE